MPKSISSSLKKRLTRIKIFLCDVDGVLTDGSIFIGGEREFKRFNIRDGLGIVLARRAGLKVGWVSARPSLATKLRADELKIDFLVQQNDRTSKTGAIQELLTREKLGWDDVCFVEDDDRGSGTVAPRGLRRGSRGRRGRGEGGGAFCDPGRRRSRRSPRSHRDDLEGAGKLGTVRGALFGMKIQLNSAVLILSVLRDAGILLPPLCARSQDHGGPRE